MLDLTNSLAQGLRHGISYAETAQLLRKVFMHLQQSPAVSTGTWHPYGFVTIQVAQCLGSASGLSNLLLSSFCYIELPLMPPMETNYTF